jgi:DNA-binding transcriptional LysR family regulator
MQFYRCARGVLQQLASMQYIGAGKGAAVAGKVTLGLPVSVAQMLAVPVVKALKQQYPDIVLCVIEYPSSYLTELLLNRRLDLSMLFVESPPRGIHAQPMVREDLYAIGLPRKATSTAVTLSDLHQIPLVLPARMNNVRSILNDACVKEGVELNVVTESSNPLTMVRLVRAGEYATILPLSALPVGETTDDLNPVLIEPLLSRSLALCAAVEAPQEPALLAVQQVAQDTIDELLAEGRCPGAQRHPARTSDQDATGTASSLSMHT